MLISELQCRSGFRKCAVKSRNRTPPLKHVTLRYGAETLSLLSSRKWKRSLLLPVLEGLNKLFKKMPCLLVPRIRSPLCVCVTAGKCILRTTLCCSCTRTSLEDGAWTSAPGPGREETCCSSSATSTSTSQPTSSTPAGSTRSPVRHTHTRVCVSAAIFARVHRFPLAFR